MEEVDSAAMKVYLDGLAPASKLIYTRKMEAFLEFCHNGNEDGPYDSSLEDVSEYIINLHDTGYKTSTLWTTLSIIVTFFEFGKDANVNSQKKLMYLHLKKWEKEEVAKKAKVSCLEI